MAVTPLDLHTERLWLRPWRDEDVDAFATLNADPRAMEHFPALLSRQETEAVVARFRAHFAHHGWGLWAVEVPGVAPFIGFVGLYTVPFQAPFTPAVEVGWRLAPAHWSHGYATEGARAVLELAFQRLALPEVVSFTVPANVRSRRVMEKLGLHHSPEEDFDHPRLPEGHALRRHVLYRVKRSEWLALRGPQ
ncbi:GNAT family N-acetyltransferase [Archangium sp.]|jgi:ribosomal-protein-alanine N-acetyltransferase|uniref:GNAT family N-acetyltransferase n=1 Tax=Archangium sp. TaxID=1872627 RepID=UPI002ED82FFB